MRLMSLLAIDTIPVLLLEVTPATNLVGVHSGLVLFSILSIFPSICYIPPNFFLCTTDIVEVLLTLCVWSYTTLF